MRGQHCGQLLREYGRRLPCLKIRDWLDFARRGVMLDVSRGRVPKLETLLDLVERLADFKINEFQLYNEHTFAYRPTNRLAGLGRVDGGRDSAPRRALSRARYRPRAESKPSAIAHFLEHPWVKKSRSLRNLRRFDRRFCVSPRHAQQPGTIKFIRELYDEFVAETFFHVGKSASLNVGCDETWDLGRGQSKNLRTTRQGRVYVDFLKRDSTRGP